MKRLLFFAVLIIYGQARPDVIEVPNDASTIQIAFSSSQSGDTILLNAAIYEETIRIPVGTRTLTSRYLMTGDTLDRDLTVLVPGDTVQADTACVLLLMQPCTLRVVGLTIEFGRGVRRSNGRREGGAIFGIGSTLEITDCVFRNCFGDFGVCVWASNCNLSLRSSRFEENGRVDGVTASQGCIRTTDCNVFVDSCRFSRNTVTGAPAILGAGGAVTIERCLIDSNVNPAATLGAITTSGAELVVRETVFQDNIQSSQHLNVCIGADYRVTIDGCAFICNEGRNAVSVFGDSAIISECLFEGNESLLYSPSCIALGNGYNHISTSTFLDNTSDMWSLITSNGTTLIDSCVFRGNASLNDSGAVMSASQDSFVLTNCVFENNTPYAFSTDFWWYAGYIDARNCYWGAASGPYQEILNPDGDGDAILGTDVLFDPWLQESPLSVSQPHEVPTRFELARAYPNPFNSGVTIEFSLPHQMDVELSVYDVLGRRVADILSGNQVAGERSVYWNADLVPSGIYFARLTSKGTKEMSQTIKLMLLK